MHTCTMALHLLVQVAPSHTSSCLQRAAALRAYTTLTVAAPRWGSLDAGWGCPSLSHDER